MSLQLTLKMRVNTWHQPSVTGSGCLTIHNFDSLYPEALTLGVWVANPKVTRAPPPESEIVGLSQAKNTASKSSSLCCHVRKHNLCLLARETHAPYSDHQFTTWFPPFGLLLPFGSFKTLSSLWVPW
ncbi:uncharacterized protein [Cicer arietinum]|uniref:uncharacterized protein isoform X2 n=1 Tax=Cicer arietinum TaxID=3827 RepID=UPI003CC68470